MIDLAIGIRCGTIKLHIQVKLSEDSSKGCRLYRGLSASRPTW